MMEKIKVAAVSGPTASGKSELAVALAKALKGEVLSCDSMQIYKGMDIGTGKITKEEMQDIPHHFLSFADPEDSFSLADFMDLAKEGIKEISGRGRLPILCGGTGLYLQNLLENTQLSEAPADWMFRKRAEEKSNAELWEQLRQIDPICAEKTHCNNRKRVVRALEIYESTGKTKTEWDEASKNKEKPYDDRLILLIPQSREQLYERINRRVDGMFVQGLEEEAKRIFEKKLSVTAASAIGYKEFLPYFRKECSLEDVKDAIKQASRNYAKRQLTWFRKLENRALVLDFTKESFEEMLRKSVEFLR